MHVGDCDDQFSREQRDALKDPHTMHESLVACWDKLYLPKVALDNIKVPQKLFLTPDAPLTLKARKSRDVDEILWCKTKRWRGNRA
jgi:hypothetical protein